MELQRSRVCVLSLRSRLVLTNIGVTLTDLTNIGEKLTVFTLIFGALIFVTNTCVALAVITTIGEALKYLSTRRYSPLCRLPSSSYGELWPWLNSFWAFGHGFFGPTVPTVSTFAHGT